MAAPGFSSTPNPNPATYAASVTPDTPLPRAARAFYVGGTGNLVLRMADGANQTFVGVPAGVLPIGSDLVVASGTTATNIVALF